VKKAKSLKLSHDSGTDNKEEKPAKKKKSQKLVEGEGRCGRNQRCNTHNGT
jgi:hypothetical protein